MRRRSQTTIGALGIALVTALCVAGVAAPASAIGTVATVPDAALVSCLETELGVAPATPITVEQIATVTSLYCEDVGDLTGLEHATSLTILIVDESTVASLAPLTDITTLERLTLYGSGTSVTDLTPLADSPVLEVLEIDNAPVTSLAAVASMPALDYLDLSSSQISDLTPLSALHNLSTLYLWGSKVADLGPLATVSTLERLYLENAPVSDLSPLGSMTSLRALSLYGTAVHDLAPIVGNTELWFLDFTDTAVSSVEPLRALTKLTLVYGGGAAVSDVTAIGSSLAEIELEDQHVTFGSVKAGATVPNPLRGFGGELLAPSAASLTAAGATLSADFSELVFSTPGDYELLWYSELLGGAGESRTFGGTLEVTVLPADIPTIPAIPAASEVPAAPEALAVPEARIQPATTAPELAATGVDLGGWLTPTALLLIGGGIALTRVRRRA